MKGRDTFTSFEIETLINFLDAKMKQIVVNRRKFVQRCVKLDFTLQILMKK